MTNIFARRSVAFIRLVNFHSLPRSSVRVFSSAAGMRIDDDAAQTAAFDVDAMRKPFGHNNAGLSPLFPSRDATRWSNLNIEVVDHDAWQVSSGLSQAWHGQDASPRTESVVEDLIDGAVSDSNHENESDVDDIEDMRIRGKLFYKLEKDSKEFEEYHYEFHGKGSKKHKNEKKKKTDPKQRAKEENAVSDQSPLVKKQSDVVKFPQKLLETISFCPGKRVRTLTFNQLTGPYHEPFCLDIFISKGSVRACIVHRATSKVVAVAHSISKDIKFELGSTRDAEACATVGRLLAQRALEDDIHDAIYTPRKGEKLEGKLLLVLHTVIDRGVNVKLKIKQRKPKKGANKLCP
uniref:Ribosomal protein L18 n=1 Tax=Kalanchoe fedtschenkoi TaxID=63787 RepID=A0A7N0TE27_KALFE